VASGKWRVASGEWQVASGKWQGNRTTSTLSSALATCHLPLATEKRCVRGSEDPVSRLGSSAGAYRVGWAPGWLPAPPGRGCALVGACSVTVAEYSGGLVEMNHDIFQSSPLLVITKT